MFLQFQNILITFHYKPYGMSGKSSKQKCFQLP